MSRPAPAGAGSRARTTPRLLAGLVLLLVPLWPAPAHSTSVASITSVTWAGDATTAVAGGRVSATIVLSAGDRTTVTVHATGATVAGIPSACDPSSVLVPRSFVDESGDTLTCLVHHSDVEQVLAVDLDVTAVAGATVGVSAQSGAAGTGPPGPPALPVTTGPVAAARELRLLSSPDFLNADVGDLRRGPGFWDPGRSPNGTDASYQHAIDHVMDDWAAQRPDDVLVAGDLVDGRWGRDDHHTGTFGPVATPRERRAAVRRAAETYYPQWLERFARRGLDVYPLMGDHEYGDNPWGAGKRALAPTFESMFARYFTEDADGGPRFPDHPRGPHARTAYAWRPSPDVQVVNLDEFDIGPGHARIRLDRPQLHWLARVLGQAEADGVRWTLVEGHVPILEPVRALGSSQLRYQGGERSALWRLLTRFHVDAYLCGEVHDTTAITRDGVLQLAHGGAFQYGLTTYALLDFYADRLQITLNDFAARAHDRAGGLRLWETARNGMPARITVRKRPFTIGTLTLGADGTVSDRTGILLPWQP